MADTGERVKWSNLQRVELPDMDAVSTMQQSNLARLEGALLDNYNVNSVPRGGLLSRLNYNGTNPAAVTFGAMTIAYVPDGPTADDAGQGQVFKYDRTLAWQITYSTASLNFSGVGGNKPFVWARRIEVDADDATRRFWDELTELEYTTMAATRVREVVELALSPSGSDNSPPSVGTWVRIARLESVGSEVVLSPRHDFDGHDAVYETDATTRANGSGVRFYPGEPEVDVSRHPTLPELARYMIATLCKIHDGRRLFNPNGRLANASVANLRSWRHGWLDDTFRGLKQLQDESDALDDRVTLLETVSIPAPSIALVIEVTWDGAAFAIRTIYSGGSVLAGIPSGAVTRGTGHGFELSLVPFVGVSIYSVISTGASLPLTAGDAPNVIDTYPVLRLRGADVYPATSIITLDGYTVSEANDVVDTVPMIITVFAGTTPPP